MTNICKIEGCSSKIVTRKSGLCSKHYQCKRRNGDPEIRIRRIKGTGSYSNGYKILGKENKKYFEHVAVAEQALGKALPIGAVVHHIDGNPSNNISTNLVICPSQAYHLLLHTRQDKKLSLGVCERSGPVWLVRFSINGEGQYFGTFYSYEEACLKAIAVRKQYGLLAGFWITNQNDEAQLEELL